MHSLRIGFRSAIDARRWRRIRRSISTTTTASALPAVVAGSVLVAAVQGDPGLAGIWRRDDGQLVQIFHVGREVRSAYLVPAAGSANRFELGGQGLLATVSGDALEGRFFAVRRDAGSTDCPNIPFGSWVKVELAVVEDGSRLVGRWMNSEWTYDDCVVEHHWQDIAYERVDPVGGGRLARPLIGAGISRE